MVQSITNNLIISSQKSFADFGLNTYGSNAPEQIGEGFLRVKKNMKRPSGDIYLIKSGIYYKIGKSSNFKEKNRLAHYKTHNPDIKLIFTRRVKDYWLTELELKHRYKEKRLYGEWFKLLDNDVNDIFKFLYNKQSSSIQKNIDYNLLINNKLL